MPNPPNYAAGLLLSLLIPGSGLTYLGRWGWHLAWLLSIGALIFAALIGSLLSWHYGWALVALAWLGSLIQYHLLFRQWPHGPIISDGAKLGLITGHAVLHLFGLGLTGLSAALIIPATLASNQNSYDAAAANCARNLRLMEAVYRVDQGRYATSAQLTGRYTLAASCRNVLVQASRLPSADQYGFRVESTRGGKVYLVTPEGVQPENQ
jgi:hypothetical protein